jgi:hypothetical protein
MKSELTIKKGKLNYDQSGRAYPDNPEKKKNWEYVWLNEGKYYKIINLPYHAEWEEIKNLLELLK